MNAVVRCTVLALLALAAGVAVAQEKSATDENKILEESAKKDEGTTSAPPPDEENNSTTYSGIGLSRVSTKFVNVKPAINLDVALGFRIPTVQWFAVELNLGYYMIPGQVTKTSGGTSCPPLIGGIPDPTCTPSSGNTTTSQNEFQPINLGVFAVVRSPGKFYGMGKLGYRYLNTGLPELENDRSGTAWGAGFGYRWNQRGSYAELHYTKLSRDVTAIGFELAYGFDRR